MKLKLRWSVAVSVVVCPPATIFTCLPSSSVGATLSVKAIPSEFSNTTTCGDWGSWAPPRVDPAIVMQVVSQGYVDLERNFIRLMELNSAFTRQNLFLMCLDDASVPIFAHLGIHCVPLGMLTLQTHEDLWKIRVNVLSCLVAEGYNVILSDSDALWLGDPMDYIDFMSSSNVIASRGGYPRTIGIEWGATMCMGFAMFKATGAAMNTFQDAMERIVQETGDDQIAVNRAALELGIVWDQGSDMRYTLSTEFGKGIIADLSGDDGKSFEIALLPHNTFTRQCTRTPINNETMVAHCFHKKRADAKTSWMKELNLWSPNEVTP